MSAEVWSTLKDIAQLCLIPGLAFLIILERRLTRLEVMMQMVFQRNRKEDTGNE